MTYRKGFADSEQLAYAVAHKRAILTHNASDFVSLAKQYFDQKHTHYGIIVAPHLMKGELLRRIEQVLQTTTGEHLINTVRFA